MEWDEIQSIYKAALRDAYNVLATSRDPLWLAADAPIRKELVIAVAENTMVRDGYVPSSWRYLADCQNCGEVPVAAPHSGTLVGCPWCANGGKPSVYCFV